MELEYKILCDFKYFYDLAEMNGSKLTRDEMRDAISKHGHRFYEVYLDGKKSGVVFSMKIDGVFTLDGYSELKGKKAFFAAVKAGKKLCEEINDDVWTAHGIEEVVLTRLAERIGFKKVRVTEGKIVMRRNKYGD